MVRVITRCCEDLEKDFPSKKDEVNKCKSYKRKKGRKRKALILWGGGGHKKGETTAEQQRGKG